MKNFDFSRFTAVARWDLAVNRPFYTKAVIFISSLISLPVLLKYMNMPWFHALSSGTPVNAWQVLADDSVFGLATSMFTIASIIMVVIMGYTFHNMLTKQGRINELTLPASNLERFSWHAVRTFIGGGLVILGSILLADLLHVILGFVVLRQTSFHSIFLAIIDVHTSIIKETMSGYAAVMAVLTVFVMTINHLTIFVLGNAWKYRHNIIQTILFLMALSLVGVVLLGYTVSFIANAENLVSYLEKLFDNVSLETAVTCAFIFSVVLCALMWWAAYRLYVHAQITTRRNP